MVENTLENQNTEKLAEEPQKVSLDLSLDNLPKRTSDKKHTRKLAEPHIKGRKVGKKVYYRYCRGADKEIYLGDAVYILQAVMEKRRILK